MTCKKGVLSNLWYLYSGTQYLKSADLSAWIFRGVQKRTLACRFVTVKFLFEVYQNLLVLGVCILVLWAAIVWFVSG